MKLFMEIINWVVLLSITAMPWITLCIVLGMKKELAVIRNVVGYLGVKAKVLRVVSEVKNTLSRDLVDICLHLQWRTPIIPRRDST